MLDIVSTFCFSFRGFAEFLISPILSNLVSLTLLCPITPIALLVANKYLNSELSFGDPFPKVMVTIMRVCGPSVAVISFLISRSNCWFYYYGFNPLHLNSQVTVGHPPGCLQIILSAFEKPLLCPEMAKAEGLCRVKTLGCLP
ncbi:uncharacterized protein EV154DRAFT_488728 [Mucor mucedo]|uniref:uncharacterized protein n=1 Tax=Mucor mucedo TaxID=29922 RepID=UPI00221FE0CE|nr:uncharacterized protein EV154DRAFT_488728 [Mucor mucedo]KAI7865320.1 hypothetical protein EV154DRAFT_488728 [Mucor mucedo]